MRIPSTLLRPGATPAEAYGGSVGTFGRLSVARPSVRTMSKTPHPSYLCSECGWTSAKWVGRCGECQAWGSVAEAAAARTTRADPGPVTSAAVPIAQVSVDSAAFRSSATR